MSRHLHHLTNCPFEVKKGWLKGLSLNWEVILLIFFVAKRYFFGRKRPLLCGGSVLLSRHELCRIYALFWSDFDADFYADIEDFVQILCRFLHKKMLIGTSGYLVGARDALQRKLYDFWDGKLPPHPLGTFPKIHPKSHTRTSGYSRLQGYRGFKVAQGYINPYLDTQRFQGYRGCEGYARLT